MRTLLRRMLLGWWLIPMLWIVCFPVFWLLAGTKTADQIINALSDLIWNGDEL